jgi:hypothetical protein
VPLYLDYISLQIHLLIFRNEASWNIWAEKAMWDESTRYWNGGQLERRIVDVMGKGDLAG